jgi:hypothetical protein
MSASKFIDPAKYGTWITLMELVDSPYPKRYELLDKDGNFLGIGVRFRKYQRLKWSLPFVEGARWIAGGRKTRQIRK